MNHVRAIIGTPEHWVDDFGRKWRRIIGGIGWPASGEEGAGLVLAESLDEPYYYRVLSTVFDFNADTLLEKCKAQELIFPVKQWFGNAFEQTMMVIHYEFNKKKEAGDKLQFRGAPLADRKDNSGYYLPLLISLGEEARLDAGASPKVLQELEQDTAWPETHLNKDIAAWPVLAALCYPLAYMQMYSGKVVLPLKKDYLKQYGKNAWQL